MRKSRLTKFREGKVELVVPSLPKVLSKKAEVFYNPEKEFERTISVAFLRALRKKLGRRLKILDLLAASGIRGLRFATEVDGLGKVYLNDKSEVAYKFMRENLEGNKSKLRCEVKIFNEEANELLFSLDEYFDYIDVDPFGSPNPFLDAACRFLKRGGVLAVTATDTAVLYGARKRACFKSYFSKVEKVPFMKEVGIRVLCKRVIETGAKYEIALRPIFAHAEKHYLRIYFSQDLGAERALHLLEQCGFLGYCKSCMRRYMWLGFNSEEKCKECGRKNVVIGPLFLGKIFDPSMIREMIKQSKDDRVEKLLKIALEESKLQVPYYYLTTEFASKLKVREPGLGTLLSKLNKHGKATRTIFSPKGFRTNLKIEKIIEEISHLPFP